MKQNIFATVCVLLVFVLQSTAVKWISFGGICPNLLIVIIAALGFTYGCNMGLLSGFFAGLLWDLFYGDLLGFYALVFMYVGYMNGGFWQIFFKEDIKLPVILVTGSDVIFGVTSYVMRFLLRGRFDFANYFGHVILPEAVYTALITLLIFPLFAKITTRLDRPVQKGKGPVIEIRETEV